MLHIGDQHAVKVQRPSDAAQPNILYHITDKLQFPNSADWIHKGMDADAAWHPGPPVQRTSGFGSTFQTGHR